MLWWVAWKAALLTRMSSRPKACKASVHQLAGNGSNRRHRRRSLPPAVRPSRPSARFLAPPDPRRGRKPLRPHLRAQRRSPALRLAGHKVDMFREPMEALNALETAQFAILITRARFPVAAKRCSAGSNGPNEAAL